MQPFVAFTSSALCSSNASTWLFVSWGFTAKSSAAAAETCGAANDVPSGSLYSSLPQSEKPCGTQVARSAVSASGKVEKIPCPGAERSL